MGFQLYRGVKQLPTEDWKAEVWSWHGYYNAWETWLYEHLLWQSCNLNIDDCWSGFRLPVSNDKENKHSSGVRKYLKIILRPINKYFSRATQIVPFAPCDSEKNGKDYNDCFEHKLERDLGNPASIFRGKIIKVSPIYFRMPAKGDRRYQWREIFWRTGNINGSI